jgi:hypothetical protein
MSAKRHAFAVPFALRNFFAQIRQANICAVAVN